MNGSPSFNTLVIQMDSEYFCYVMTRVENIFLPEFSNEMEWEIKKIFLNAFCYVMDTKI
jgi:hypothetical protein